MTSILQPSSTAIAQTILNKAKNGPRAVFGITNMSGKVEIKDVPAYSNQYDKIMRVHDRELLGIYYQFPVEWLAEDIDFALGK